MHIPPSRLLVLATLAALGAPAVPAPPPRTIAAIDLGAMGARGWRFTATQGPDIPDPIMGEGTAPGAIDLCVRRAPDGPCAAELRRILGSATPDHLYDDPHALQTAAIVRPHIGLALLLVRAASLHSVNGNARVGTMLLAYDRRSDRFRTAYRFDTGHNNNEEVRYIARGALHGAIVSAEPTQDAPFGYWIIVNRLGVNGVYHPVLRYRSATHYGDGNPLAVIDSEMPAIARRLGLWRPGRPLPLPEGKCATPHLVRMELWCGERTAG